MKNKIWLAILVPIFAGFLFYQFSTGELNLSSRKPTGAFTSGLLALGNSIYGGAVSMVTVPTQYVKDVAVKYGIKNYVEGIPANKEVKDRVLQQIDDDRYMRKVVPFVLTLKELYTPPADNSIQKFDDYIESVPTFKKVPGTTHELFKWKTPTKKTQNGSKLEVTKDMVALILELYDVVFLKGHSIIADDANLEKPFQYVNEKDLPLVNSAKPTVIKIFTFIKDSQKKSAAGGKPADANSDVMQIVHDILNDPDKLETATITLIDFIRYMVHKSYRFFARKALREKALADWLTTKLQQDDYRSIDAYLKTQAARNYVVHIGVDGLQGALVKAMSNPLGEQKFIKEVQSFFEKSESLAPKYETVNPPNHAHNNHFFEFLSTGNFQHEKYLPYFKKILSTHSRHVARTGISTTPTISVRNLPIVFTGAEVAGPNSTGIPNFHFVDRKSDPPRAYYFFGNDALQLDRLANEAGMITMFERLNSLNTLNCNAQYEWHSHASFEGILNLGLGESSRDFGEVLCLNHLKKAAVNEKELRAVFIKLSNEIKDIKRTSRFLRNKNLALQYIAQFAKLEQEAMPQYLLFYSPWPDHFAHFKGPFSNEILSPTGELNRLDYWLSELEKVYNDAGLKEKTVYGMAGDHGLAPIFYQLNPEINVLQAMNKGIIYKKISADEGGKPELNHPLKPSPLDKYDAIVASTAGGNYMLDFFVGDYGKTKEDRVAWSTQPVYQQLLQLKLKNGEVIDIIKEITDRLKETLDYLVVRETPCSIQECSVRLVGHRDGDLLNELIKRKDGKIFYESRDINLLDISELSQFRDFSPGEIDAFRNLLRQCLDRAVEDNIRTWCDESEWRVLTSFTSRPDSIVQLAHIYDEDRSGTINLFPAAGIGYNTSVPGRHAGEHFHEKDAFVGFWGQPVNGQKQLDIAVNGQVAPTLYEFITGKEAKKGKDGWGFDSVWKQISR